MKITYYVHDLSFPLVEGIRKQAWWMALAMRKEGHEVEVVSTGKKTMTLARDGVTIRYFKPLTPPEVITDVMHYLSHPSPLFYPLLRKVQARKQILTFFDGNCNGFWKRAWYPLLSPSFRKRLDLITIQTQYQQDHLTKTMLKDISLKRIPPLIPHYKKTAVKTQQPSLLFMSHLSEYKGIADVLDAFEKVKQNIPDLTLTICDSSIRQNRSYTQRIANLENKGVTFKGKVDSQQELSKAWIYLYPVHGAQETFSIPLSLIEAIQVETPFICSDVGGISEFFPKEFLVPPQKPDELASKIMNLLTTSHIPKLKKEIQNKRVINSFKESYGIQSRTGDENA